MDTNNRALEGLKAVLDKKPIIPTYKARELWDAPAVVQAAYEQHVRGYIPFAREGSGDDDADVTAYERRLVRAVKESRAPLGYITAEYGHGKTSTGLFLWERARAENLLAVPPFSFDALGDLVTAVAGWARFEVERVRPGLGERAQALHDRYRREGIEGMAHRHATDTGRTYDEALSDLRMLDRMGGLQLRMRGLDYVNFLTEITDLAREAGFGGVLVVADEVQQFIEHEDVTSAREPLADLFDLINTMYTRGGRLACGAIFLLPNKELGFVNERRGDLVARMKSSRLALDLGHVHGLAFPQRLWASLAEAFNLQAVTDHVITAEALRALGEIAVRSDLASGPRTVVNVLQIACTRYLQGNSPYGLHDLVTSFEQGAVAFDGMSKLQSALRQALAHPLVQGRPDAERAVRLMAAFPSTGLTADVQQRQGVRTAVEELTRLAVGDLVAIRGGGLDRDGRAVKAGVTLMALQPIEAQLSWLKGTIRDYRRNYYLGSEVVRGRAVEGFRALLTERLFPSPAWKVEGELPATALSQNRSVLLRGSFPSAQRQFPERLVCCRLLGSGEQPRPTFAANDLLIDFVLQAPHEQSAEAQRALPGRLQWLAPNHARVELNLLHCDPNAAYLDLKPGFEDIVAPYDVNPLLTLSLYAALHEHLAVGRVRAAEESEVRDLFMPALLGAALRDLFHAELAAAADPPIAAADARFVDDLVAEMCRGTYGDSYVTLMVVNSWRSGLREYAGALGRIDNPLIRAGQEPWEGTKSELAALFTKTNSSFDNYHRTYADLFEVVRPFSKGNGTGAERFKLHPLERAIQRLLTERGQKQYIMHPRTHQAIEAPALSTAEIAAALKPHGYREEEIDAAHDLLEARQLIQRDTKQGRILATEPDIPPISEVRALVDGLRSRLDRLQPVLGREALLSLEQSVKSWQGGLARDAKTLAPAQLLSAKRAAERAGEVLDQLTGERLTRLAAEAASLSTTGADDARLTAPLGQPAGGGLFVDQLNMVRVELLRLATGLREHEEGARRYAREARDILDRAGRVDDALTQAAEKITRSRQVLDVVRSQREGLGIHVGNYTEARRMLEDATSLLNDKLLPIGPPLAAQRDALESWARDIREALVTRKIDALREVEDWRRDLHVVRQAVVEYERIVRDAFNDRQQILRGLLTRYFPAGAEAMGPLLPYDLSDPPGSHRFLEHQFRTAIHRVRGQLDARIGELRRDAAELAAPDSLAILPVDERGPAARDMQEVEQQALLLEEKWGARLAELVSVASPSTPLDAEKLDQTAREVHQIAGDYQQLLTRVRAVQRLLQETRLTPAEERANVVLLALAQAGDADFLEFQRRIHQDLGGADAWALLRGLAQKARLRVRIQVLRQ